MLGITELRLQAQIREEANMRTVTIIFWLVGLSVCSVPLFGAAISSGSIQTTGLAGFGPFTLSGSNFDASGGFANGNWGPASCSPCLPGSILGVDGLVSGNAFVGGGAAIINGIPFSNVNWGDLNAHGPSIFMITGPGIVLNNGAGTYLGDLLVYRLSMRNHRFFGCMRGKPTRSHRQWTSRCAGGVIHRQRSDLS